MLWLGQEEQSNKLEAGVGRVGDSEIIQDMSSNLNVQS